MAATVDVLGIRHHGPGSARAVRRALDETGPDAVVIEGPPELDALLVWAGSPDLRPPVAALVYGVDDPRRAAFYPMASFSPEWVAMRWALASGVPVHFADLPATHDLAADGPEDRTRHADPIAELARAGGYDDAERWWDDAVEHRDGAVATFDAIRDAMGVMRADGAVDEHTLRREAAMRRVLRPLVAERHRVAVVCGAWHAPVLHPDAFPTVKDDRALLTRLPKVKVAATWAPWTSQRLGYRSGYGAGVGSPGWYRHCFTTPADQVVSTWMVRVAGALRAHGLEVSSASVIEATRLAETLATVRGRPLAGLDECEEAALAALCDGSTVPLQLVHEEVVVGHELGEVPDDAPQVPLARDLAAQQRSCRLKPKAGEDTVVLDLRTPGGLRRSVLLHRLTVLGIPWGIEVDAGRTTGTFKEAWLLEWQPELAVRVVEAGLWGTTVESAATARLVDRAGQEPSLAALSAMVEATLPAELPDALVALVRAIEAASATTHDTVALMQAVEPLARTVRYGSVRGLDTDVLADVLHASTARVAVGLGPACASLDDEAASVVRAAIDGVARAVGLLDDEVSTERWWTALVGVADQRGVHGSVAGRVVRLLRDADRLDADEAARRLSRQLSRASDGVQVAAWVDGFLEGPAVLLLHDDQLLGVLDDWLAATPDPVFDDLLPLLRRTFSRYQPAERRAVGQRLRHRAAGLTDPAHQDGDVDDELAAPAVATVLALLAGRSP